MRGTGPGADAGPRGRAGSKRLVGETPPALRLSGGPHPGCGAARVGLWGRGVPIPLHFPAALRPGTARTRVRAAPTRLKSVVAQRLAPPRARALRPHRGGPGPGQQTRGGRGEGAPGRLPDARAGRRARAHAHWPLLAHLGLTLPCGSGVPGSQRAPDPRPARRLHLLATRAFPRPRGPQPRWEGLAGAFPNHRHTGVHASARRDASGRSGQPTTVVSAERERPGEGVRAGFGGAGAMVSRGKKTNRPASLPLLSAHGLSQDSHLSTATPPQACGVCVRLRSQIRLGTKSLSVRDRAKLARLPKVKGR